MHRFFLLDAPSLVPGALIDLPEKMAHQARSVLHLNVGEQVVLLDNSGDEALCVLRQSSRIGVVVEVLECRAGRREPSIHITLCQGLLKSARFEWILEKGTELGVTSFIPVHCRRSIAEEVGAAKTQRWQRIIQEAAEQCGRARLPELRPLRSLAQMLNDLPSGPLALMLWEEEQVLSLRIALRAGPSPAEIVLFIGPEGGLQADEVEQARERGVRVVTLGSRILRAETAALATIASVIYELEL